MPIMNFMTSYYLKTKKYTGTNFVLPSFSSIILLLTFAIPLLFSSCEENATDIGSGLLPAGDFTSVDGTDTLKVEAFTSYSDSVRTSGTTYSYLGGLYDPYFGNVTTEFVAQLRLQEKWSGKGEFKVDSVRLTITISGAKGDLSVTPAFQIYEIDDELSPDSTYYSNRDPNASKMLSLFSLPQIEKDTLKTYTVNLPVSLGEYLTRDTVYLNQENTETDFRSFFKGVYITYGEVVKALKPLAI